MQRDSTVGDNKRTRSSTGDSYATMRAMLADRSEWKQDTPRVRKQSGVGE
jgi:hypothetical protein